MPLFLLSASSGSLFARYPYDVWLRMVVPIKNSDPENNCAKQIQIKLARNIFIYFYFLYFFGNPYNWRYGGSPQKIQVIRPKFRIA